MEDVIKVSIIIPAYNVGKYIQRCIESASNQTLQDIEIIVVIDGATDNTLEVATSCAKKDLRIIIIDKNNGGVSSARNTGLDVAQGEFVQYLDGDDWLELTASEELYTYAIKNNLDIVVSNFYKDDDNGNLSIFVDLPFNDILAGKECLTLLFKNTIQPCVWNKLIKKSLYRKIYFPTYLSIGEDLATTSKLLYKAKRVGKLEKPFLHYIFNPKSLTNSVLKKKGFEAVLACNEIKSFLEKENDFDKYKEEYAALFEPRVLLFLYTPSSTEKNYLIAEALILDYFKNKKSFSFNNHNCRLLHDKFIFFILNISPYNKTLTLSLLLIRSLRGLNHKLNPIKKNKNKWTDF